MEQKKETKKIVMQVSPLDKNLGTDGMEKYADKIRRKDTNKLRKVRKSFNDQGYRLPNIRETSLSVRVCIDWLGSDVCY